MKIKGIRVAKYVNMEDYKEEIDVILNPPKAKEFSLQLVKGNFAYYANLQTQEGLIISLDGTLVSYGEFAYKNLIKEIKKGGWDYISIL